MPIIGKSDYIPVTVSAYGGFFEFSTQSCQSYIDTIHDEQGKEQYLIKVKPNEKTLAYRHVFKSGLRFVERHGKDDEGPLEKLPVTEEFYQVLNHLQKEWKDAHYIRLHKEIITARKFTEQAAAFFDKFGFFIPLKKDAFTTFTPQVIGAVCNRMRAFSLLMSAVDEAPRDYNKLFAYTFMLALTKPVNLYAENTPDCRLEIYKHPLCQAYENIDFNCEPTEWYHEYELENLFPKKQIDAALYPEKPTVEQTDDFEVYEEISVPPSYLEIYPVKDFFMGADEGEETYNFIRRQFYDDEVPFEDGDEVKPEDRAAYLTEKRIKYLYVHGKYSDRTEKLFYDFLYHFHFEVDKIRNIDPDALYPIKLKNKIDLNKTDAFNDRFKAVLLQLAGITIKNQLDNTVTAVRPCYNLARRTAGWTIPDLYTAIYYSLFLKTKDTVYRVCALPECSTLFSIEATNRRQLFCSDGCRKTMSSRVERRRNKMGEPKREKSKTWMENVDLELRYDDDEAE